MGSMSQHTQQQATNHSYMRHGNQSQNPQEVANNILQMAATSYQPSHTVHVPLNKASRPAPYHIPPKSPHNYSIHGSSKDYMMSNHPFAYPNSAPPQPTGSRTSPVSPMYMHSPASHHSGQSLPNSSPRSIHSPSHTMVGGSIGSSACKKSPHAMVLHLLWEAIYAPQCRCIHHQITARHKILVRL